MNLPTSLKVTLRRKVRLASYCTMQVGGQADWFAEPTTESELIELLEFVTQQNLPFALLGKGSNSLFPDEGYPGLVISMLRYEQDQIHFDLERKQVHASAGIFLYRLVLACRAQQLSGIEFLANVPGTLGGALVMNAGFSRESGKINEIGNIVSEVAFYDLQKREKVIWTQSELEFSYRKSNLNDKIVLSAKLNLTSRPEAEIQNEIQANFDYRNREQDLKFPSSGSIFKNPEPPAPSAGKLIDELSLKGFRVGGAMVSEKHGNYFVNVGGAKTSDIKKLIQKIQEVVFDAKGVRLEPEVRFIQP